MSKLVYGASIVVIAVIGTTALAMTNGAAPEGKLHSALQIKPGLWEFEDSPKVAGDTVFPDAVIARIPIAERAQHLSDLRKMISQPSRERECISQAAFEQRLFAKESGCNHTVAANSPSRLEILTECFGENGSFRQTQNRRILATGPEAVATSFHAVSTQLGKTMTIDSVERGHWVSSTCGNVRGIQQL